MAGRVNWEANVSSNVREVLEYTDKLRGELEKLENGNYGIKLNIDEKRLANVISNLDKMLSSLGKGTGDFKQFENLSKELSGIISEVQNLNKAFGKVDDSGTKTLLSSIQNIDKSLSELSQHIINVNKNMGNIGGDTNGTVKQVENISNAYDNAFKSAEKLVDAQKNIDTDKSVIDSSATVAEINKITQATKELNKAQTGSENIQSKSFTTKNKTEAYNQLKQMADLFKNFYGNEEAMHTKAGTEAAYAYYKAYEEALKKGVAQSRLESVTVDVDADSSYNANKLSSNRIKDFESFKKYGGDITDLSEEILSLEGKLLDFADAYTKVKANLGDAPITPDIIRNIENYVELLDKARYLESFGDDNDKDIISDRRNSAQFWLDDALFKAKIQNEEYISSLKEVKEEKEKLDVSLNKSQTSDVDSSVVEQQNKIKEELKETQKQAEQTSESLSKIGDGNKSNISTGLDSSLSKYKEIASLVKEYYELSNKQQKTSKKFQSIPEDYDRIDSYLLSKSTSQKVGSTDIEKDINKRYHEMSKGINEGSDFAIKAMKSAIQRYWSNVTEMPSDESLLSSRKIIPYGNKRQKEEYIIPKKYQELEKSVIQETIAMNKNNASYEEERKQVEANNAALQERMNVIRNLIKSNPKNSDYNGEYKMGLSLKASDKNKTDIFSMANSMSYEDMLKEICNMLGVEIPQATEKANKALSNVGVDKSNISSENATATEEAAQAQKDFATANEKAQSSADGSKTPLQLEAELMESIAKSAHEAAEAKKEFVEANKQVKSGAESSSTSLDEEKKKIENVGDSAEETKKKTEGFDEREADNQKLEQQKRIYQELNDTINRYATIAKRIASKSAYSTDEEDLARLQARIEELRNEPLLSEEQLDKSQRKLDEIETTVEDIQKRVVNTTLDNLQGDIDNYYKRHEKYSIKPKDVDRNPQYTKDLEEYKSTIDKLASEKQRLNDLKLEFISEDDLKYVKELESQLAEIENRIKGYSAAEKGSDEQSRLKQIDKINKYLEENTRISQEAKYKLRELLQTLENDGAAANVKKINEEFIRITNNELAAGRAGKTFMDVLKDKRFYSFAGQIASYFSFYDIINVIRRGAQEVRELNKALTEMRKVSDESLLSLKEYQNLSFDMGDEVGTTGKQIMESTADWLRLGESMKEASKSASTSNILLNVSEFESIDEATESLVSMSQAYKDLDKIEIVDVLNNLGKLLPKHMVTYGDL